MKVVPVSGPPLCAVSVPWWASTIARAMVRPRPDPGLPAPLTTNEDPLGLIVAKADAVESYLGEDHRRLPTHSAEAPG